MRIYHEENNGSDLQETGSQVRDFISWCFKLRHCSLDTFLERLGLETFFWNVSVLRVQRLGLVSVLESLKKWNVSVLKVDRLGLVSFL